MDIIHILLSDEFIHLSSCRSNIKLDPKMEVDVEAGLQFAVGLLQHRMSASNTPLSLRDSMETIGARLLSLHFPGLRSAKPFLHTGVDRLGRSFLNAADAVDDLIEAKERATD